MLHGSGRGPSTLRAIIRQLAHAQRDWQAEGVPAIGTCSRRAGVGVTKRARGRVCAEKNEGWEGCVLEASRRFGGHRGGCWGRSSRTVGTGTGRGDSAPDPTGRSRYCSPSPVRGGVSPCETTGMRGQGRLRARSDRVVPLVEDSSQLEPQAWKAVGVQAREFGRGVSPGRARPRRHHGVLDRPEGFDRPQDLDPRAPCSGCDPRPAWSPSLALKPGSNFRLGSASQKSGARWRRTRDP